MGVLQLIWPNHDMPKYHHAGIWSTVYKILPFLFKTYSSSSSLVITSRWFATSRLVAPVSVRLVYCIYFLPDAVLVTGPSGQSHDYPTANEATLTNTGELPWWWAYMAVTQYPEYSGCSDEMVRFSIRWRHNERDGVSNHLPAIFAEPFIQAQIKGNIKAPRHWPLCGEFTGHRWIPRTKGQ